MHVYIEDRQTEIRYRTEIENGVGTEMGADEWSKVLGYGLSRLAQNRRRAKVNRYRLNEECVD